MAERPLPDPAVATEWLGAMLLIRRFEERASRLYAEGRIGGFLHASTGEEATIVGSVRALRDTDHLLSTYRAHGHALARGTPPGRVMAELLGRVDGVSGGRGGSTHLMDRERRFMGGFGIVGGHLPIGAGIALSADVQGRDDVTLCHFSDGAAQQGMFAETLNLAALWNLPLVFLATNNRLGSQAPPERLADAADLLARVEALGVAGLRCDGMDVADTYATTAEAVALSRSERRPVLVEALTSRFRGHSAADPAEQRSAEQLEEWRRRDPVAAFGDHAVAGGALSAAERDALDAGARRRVDEAVAFALASPEPAPESLFDHVPGA